MSEYLLKIDSREEISISNSGEGNKIFHSDKTAVSYAITLKKGDYTKVKTGVRGILVSAKNLRKMFGKKAETMLTEEMRRHPNKLAVLTSEKKLVPFNAFDFLVAGDKHFLVAFAPMALALVKKRKEQALEEKQASAQKPSSKRK